MLCSLSKIKINILKSKAILFKTIFPYIVVSNAKFIHTITKCNNGSLYPFPSREFMFMPHSISIWNWCVAHFFENTMWKSIFKQTMLHFCIRIVKYQGPTTTFIDFLFPITVRVKSLCQSSTFASFKAKTPTQNCIKGHRPQLICPNLHNFRIQ